MEIKLILNTAFRLLFGFVCLLIYMNIIGKMQLAPTSPIDQIGNYVLGGIIGGIIYNLDIPIWQFFSAIVLWGGLMIGVNYLRRKNIRAKRIIDGKPILCMTKGKLQTNNLEKAKISADDLLSKLHQNGVAKVEDIDTLWIEPNGQLTIVKKDDDKLAWTLIVDGQINELDMIMSGMSQEWLQEEIEKQGILNIGEIFCAQLSNNKLTVYPYL